MLKGFYQHHKRAQGKEITITGKIGITHLTKTALNKPSALKRTKCFDSQHLRDIQDECPNTPE
jgi:hypothetical protein